MFKNIFVLIIMFIFISGCSDGQNDIRGTHVSSNNDEGPSSFTAAFHDSDDVDGFLTGVGRGKFFEGSLDYNDRQLNAFNIAFKPAFVPENMQVWRVSATDGVYGVQYRNIYTNAQINFIWSPGIPNEIHMNEIFGRGEVGGYWKEHNGITYAVSEWVDRNTQESAGYGIKWIQNGHNFTTSATAGVTLEEALAFSYATPVTAWQLDGDAVSVSIQDMTDVTIVALSDIDPTGRSGVSALSGMRQEVIVSGDNLYLSGLARDSGLELIGYRWLVDAAANRYQYVLAPGIYEFRASGATINSELLVRHFEAGEVALITDFTAEVSDPDVTEFALIVTPDEVYDFTTEPDEPEQITPYVLVSIEGSPVIEGEILYLSDHMAWALEIEVFPSEDVVTGQPIVTASDPEVWIEEWNGAFFISGSAWSIFEPALITVTVPTVNGDIEVSFYVSFYSVVVR